MQIVSAEIDVIVHVTEDQDKIFDIMKQMLKIDPNTFTITNLKGHYGNEIKFIRITLDSKDATELAYNIIDSMNIYDKMNIYNNIEKHVEGNSFYIRISKQDLFKRRIVLKEENAIKIRFKFKDFKREQLKNLIKI